MQNLEASNNELITYKEQTDTKAIELAQKENKLDEKTRAIERKSKETQKDLDKIETVQK